MIIIEEPLITKAIKTVQNTTKRRVRWSNDNRRIYIHGGSRVSSTFRDVDFDGSR